MSSNNIDNNSDSEYESDSERVQIIIPPNPQSQPQTQLVLDVSKETKQPAFASKKPFDKKNAMKVNFHAPQKNMENQQDNTCTKPCTYGLECTRNTCSYAHTISELRAFQCGWGEECYNEKCRYWHPDSEDISQYYKRTGKQLPNLPHTGTRVGPNPKEDQAVLALLQDLSLESKAKDTSKPDLSKVMAEERALCQYLKKLESRTKVDSNEDISKIIAEAVKNAPVGKKVSITINYG